MRYWWLVFGGFNHPWLSDYCVVTARSQIRIRRVVEYLACFCKVQLCLYINFKTFMLVELYASQYTAGCSLDYASYSLTQEIHQ